MKVRIRQILPYASVDSCHFAGLPISLKFLPDSPSVLRCRILPVASSFEYRAKHPGTMSKRPSPVDLWRQSQRRGTMKDLRSGVKAFSTCTSETCSSAPLTIASPKLFHSGRRSRFVGSSPVRASWGFHAGYFDSLKNASFVPPSVSHRQKAIPKDKEQPWKCISSPPSYSRDSQASSPEP